MKNIPRSIAVLGVGIIGIELGQAMHRLGVKTTIIGRRKVIGGLSDSEINEYVASSFQNELDISFDGFEVCGVTNDGLVRLKSGSRIIEVEKVLVALGRKPSIESLKLDNLGIKLEPGTVPDYSRSNYRLSNFDNIYFVGDVNGERPLLHEASDQGKIAGYNAANSSEQGFRTRTPLSITFSDPNIAVIGKSFKRLKEENINFIVGQVSFEGQGRSIVKLKEKGLLKIYAKKEDGLLLGAELFAPSGEHLAHLISWAISLNLTADETLSLPFYHPVIEEGLRTALRNVASQIEKKSRPLEIYQCEAPYLR